MKMRVIFHCQIRNSVAMENSRQVVQSRMKNLLNLWKMIFLKLDLGSKIRYRVDECKLGCRFPVLI